MNTLRKKRIIRNKDSLYFWTNGVIHKPVIFFLHGAAVDHTLFDDQFAALKDDYSIIAWDARGHGASKPISSDFTITDLAQDAVAILESLEVPSATLVGQSHGSMIAQEVYRLRPEKVDAIVSIGGTPIMLPYTKLDVLTLNYSTLVIKLWPYNHFIKLVARKTAATKRVRDYSLKILEKSSRKDMLRIWGSVADALTVHGIKDMHITVPLLITYGEHDHTGQVQKNNQRWKHYEPTAEFVIIPEAGHNANQDNPAYFNTLLLSFLATVYGDK
jgi:3-oxoadipate enol-lactonase